METDIKTTTPRSVRLVTGYDCRRLLAKMINQVIRGEVKEGKAKTIGYLIQVLTKTIEQADTEQRIAAIEQQLAQISAKKKGKSWSGEV